MCSLIRISFGLLRFCYITIRFSFLLPVQRTADKVALPVLVLLSE